jgi:hypothetical protein
MKFGSSARTGAAIIPATAERAAASPQPTASMRVTRIPIRRLVRGRSADARIWRPVRVRRKNRNTTRTQANETMIVPTSCQLITTSPIVISEWGKGLSNAFISGVQIQPASPLSRMSNAIVAITIASSPPRCSGRITAP